ncbi:putative anti-sigma regulatory factor, serine/threonine protein kinase [Thiorhodococcus drewsii AZ1]|uniref:Putative anti-sigma regulatory factor, serine/threonine protein kinase n=1 Tax=Thiorhodococcus drewsii AZ1 TaxID=765913 RepID=G2E0H6_9GAMM|nr:anti-sigma regulatory factor [Thiorhodococcus drewsii]EGV31904.1 putative anti-sigma regulatory factor, serine/threonine protein kinase [Thiorhodococcus drewsii AZ1]
MSDAFSSTQIPVLSPADIVTARRATRDLCERLGFGKADQTRLATAVSELARNVIQYACEGVCIVEDASDNRTRRIRVQVEDRGPGITDIALAMTDGYSTSGGLGAGLPGTRRLVDDFQIESAPGRTRISITLHKPL